VGEQLREKAQAERQAGTERASEERRQEQLERHKAEERELALRHSGGERRPRPRQAYRDTPPNAWWWAGAATLVIGFVSGARGRQLLLGTGVLLLTARAIVRALDRAEHERLLAANAATAR
jgi:Flp pilus assembly protein TadB